LFSCSCCRSMGHHHLDSGISPERLPVVPLSLC
jgi:hypothetical protein